MVSLHSDPTRAIVIASVLHSVWSELPGPTKGVPYSVIHRLVATVFINHVLVQHLSGVYYVL